MTYNPVPRRDADADNFYLLMQTGTAMGCEHDMTWTYGATRPDARRVRTGVCSKCGGERREIEYAKVAVRAGRRY